MKILKVQEKDNNKKICQYLLAEFPNLKQGTLYKALRKKDIRINNIRISDNVSIRTNDEIKVFITDELLCSSNINLDIIFEDTNILVVNKPCGIEVTGENSLTTECQKYINGFVKPCHRLDRNTTGLVLFAKNEDSLNILLDKFKKHEIEKHYLATVYGIPKDKSKTLTAYLFKDNKKSLVYISDVPKKGYQKIVTSYTVINQISKENTSVLDVNLLTGRTHQIRAHLAHIGYPIIGDGKYGVNGINKKFKQKTQMLESYSLKFNFSSPSGVLEYLGGKIITRKY